MPASTPIYGITYPCGGDTIDPDVFATFATTMDAALAQGAADLDAVVNRPNSQIQELAAQAVVINVSTGLGFGTVVYDNDNMVNLAVDNGPRIVTAGAYFVRGEFQLSSGFTTLTSVNVIITVNAIERARLIGEGDVGNYGLTVPLYLDVGDYVELRALWTGTGGPANVTSRLLAVSYIAAP